MDERTNKDGRQNMQSESFNCNGQSMHVVERTNRQKGVIDSVIAHINTQGKTAHQMA